MKQCVYIIAFAWGKKKCPAALDDPWSAVKLQVKSTSLTGSFSG